MSEKHKKYYICRVCGFSPHNRSTWCDLGCGSDYNEMIETSTKGIKRNAALAAHVEPLCVALESIAYLAAKGIDYARDERTYEWAKQALAAARAAMEATDAP